MTVTRHDVVIMGGGLAGTTLALQLRQRFPELDILVLERRRHPVPEAAHKIGESTVEIGAHYFETVLGLKPHLMEKHLRKFGFRFFFSEGREDFDQALELGVSHALPTPSYQVDRGIFENFLAPHARERGIRYHDGASVRSFELGTGGQAHTVTWSEAGQEHTAEARWLIDASGRAGLVKRRLGLAEDHVHDANSVWFRIGARINVDEWSADPAWLDRCDPRNRWLSTNHLVGRGYWVWLIPLSSGSHSVGIVADQRLHPYETMNTFERAMDWLHAHQPRLARDLEGKRHLLQDFAGVRRFTYNCKQLYSGDRWALTGEAGVFLDPFYSPGSDFIAISNTYVTELVAKDFAGEPVAAYARIYEQFLRSFYDNTMTLYVDQYDIFGDPEVLPVKVTWDYAYYWGVLCQIFFQDRLTDVTTLGRLRDEFARSKDLNAAMQPLLRRWSAAGEQVNKASMIDQALWPWFVELNRGLRDTLDTEAFKARIRATTAQLAQLAAEICARIEAEQPGADTSAVRAVLATFPAVTPSPVPVLVDAA